MRWSDREAGLAGGHPGERLVAANRVGQIFVVEFAEPGLVIPHIHLRWCAGHEEVDAAFRCGRKIRQVQRRSGGQRGFGGVRHAGEDFVAHQGRQASPSQRLAHAAKKMPAAGEAQPFFTQRLWHRKIVNRRAFAVIVATGMLRQWFLRIHLFTTASRFSAALETSIQDASSGAGMDLSTLLSPTFNSWAAAAGSLE